MRRSLDDTARTRVRPATTAWRRDRARTMAMACALALAPAAVHAAPVIDSDLLARTRTNVAPAAAASPLAGNRGDRHDDVDVWLVGDVDPAAVRALGGEVHTHTGHVMTARLPVAAIASLAGLGGLERAQIAQPVELQADEDVNDVGPAPASRGPAPSYSASTLTGKRAVIGIVDTGIDPSHADFRTATGTRVRWLWDQNGYTTPPSGFAYGDEFSQSSIDAGLYKQGDTDGHGTHIAGVAGGNGRATGNGKPALTYVGIAPEADFVIVRLKYNQDGSITDDKVIDGVNYVFQKAAALGEPAVVLLAVAKMTGPHDGTDPLDAGVAAMTGPGKIVCAAAGNYANLGRHAEWTSTASGQTGNVTLAVQPYTPASNALDYFRGEAWYDGSANHSVSVVTPAGLVVGPVARGASTTVQTPSGVVNIVNGQYRSSNGAYRVDLFVYRGSLSYPQVATGTWTYRFNSQASGTSRVDAWLTTYVLGSTKPAFVSGMTEKCLVTSPATANGVVAVGAYSTQASWVAVDGHTYAYAAAVPNALAHFSSPGPRRDGALVPNIAAPGYGFAASKSSLYYPSTMYLMPDSVHCMRYGTSIAAAQAAGSIALLLQQNALLTPADAIAQLERDAVSDSYTGVTPNASWGYGKLRIQQAPLDTPEVVTGRHALALASPNPGVGRAIFEFSLAPADVTGIGAGVRLRIMDVNGRQVASMNGPAQAGRQTLVWDGRTTTGVAAPPGVYLATLEAGRQTSAVKFVRVR